VDVPGFTVKRVYVIICERCQEDITRPQTGEDIEYAEDARDAIRAHKREHRRDDALGRQ
jgi:hypothetical protein